MPDGWSQATTDVEKWDENWERLFMPCKKGEKPKGKPKKKQKATKKRK